jgi:glycoside/pentoside/hexuronide:cation symporter, GPH family
MPAKLSKKQKIIYGIGDIGFSLTGTIIGAYFAIFLTDVVGINPAIAAAAIFIGRTWDYVNDPIFGHLSDRTRTRWGRRRPFLLFGALPYALAFTLMWWRPPFHTDLSLAVYFALAYVLYDATATLAYMPYYALTPELTSDYDERTSLTATRMFFSILGGLVAFTVPLMIIGSFSPSNATRVLLMGVVFACVSAIPLLVVFFKTTERQEFMQQEQPSLRQSIRAAWGNKPFIFGMFIFLFTWVSFDILQTVLLFFIKYALDQEANSDLILAVIFITAIIALPVWNYVSKRLNKRLAYIVGIAFWAVVQLVLVTLQPTSSLELIIFLCLLAGIGVGAAHILPWSIIPDAIEWGEQKTGERHEGMFYSLITLTQKVASSFAIPLVLLVLSATGYVPNSAEQPASAILGIRIVAGPIPAAFLCLGILFALFYPLGRESYTQIVQELETRRAKRDEEQD